jgi:sugar/nucleoside kinase (ribokinase family)
MAQGSLDVTGIGHAIVDVLTQTDEAFLNRHDLAKGTMTLIDAERAESLYAQMPAGVECSGGSAANTLAGIAALGGRGAFIGKVRDDRLGGVFADDLRRLGVEFRTLPATDGLSSARCLIFVTPDAQRTMQTYLGASAMLGPSDVDVDLIARAQITYLEGYLWDPEPAKRAFLHAAEVAHAHGRKVALTLSDPFCVERHRPEFQRLVEGHVDLLFANEIEALALYESSNLEEAAQRLRANCEIVVITRSAEGCLVLNGAETHAVPAYPAPAVVDTTGAGDLFAAGFLFGLCRGWELRECARIGAAAAAEIISHYGARPQTPLAEWVSRTGAFDPEKE